MSFLMKSTEIEISISEQKLFLIDKYLVIFFSKLIISSAENALAKESIGILCNDFLKFFDGLYPTLIDGESLEYRNL